MKKYFSGGLAFILAICLCFFQSFTTEKASNNHRALDTFNWYPVNSSNQISSTTPVYTNMLKSDVIAVDPCKDKVLPNCLYGTNGTVTLGQNISGEPASQRIRRTN